MTPPPQALIQKLTDAESILCISHANADADAIGSIAAFSRAATAAGKTARIVLHERPPGRYHFCIEGLGYVLADEFTAKAAESDLILLLDTCSYSQLATIAPHIDAVNDKLCVIDHHRTFDPLGIIHWQDTNAAATGEMVFELLKRLGWPMESLTRRDLAAAILTDTGWLRFSNTSPRCLRIIADFTEAGLDLANLFDCIYRSDRRERLELQCRALEHLEFYAEDRLAVMSLRDVDFRETGARREETENLINEAMRVATVEVAIMLVETPEGKTRASFRSRDGVDVSQIAMPFGGGGHARAAGLKSDLPLDELKAQLIDAVLRALPPKESE